MKLHTHELWGLLKTALLIKAFSYNFLLSIFI